MRYSTKIKGVMNRLNIIFLQCYDFESYKSKSIYDLCIVGCITIVGRTRLGDFDLDGCHLVIGGTIARGQHNLKKNYY